MNVAKTTVVSKNPITYTKTNVAGKSEKSGKAKTDTLTLTAEARKFLDTQKELENAEKMKKKQPKDDLERFIENLNKKDDDEKSSRFLDMAKCMKIARRILNGDKVPLKDMRFLARKDPDLYKMALTFKRHNPEPKKYKTVLDEGDEESNETENSGEVSEVEGAGSGMSTSSLVEGLGE